MYNKDIIFKTITTAKVMYDLFAVYLLTKYNFRNFLLSVKNRSKIFERLAKR